MAKLASGDGISRVIGIATMPIITRIYLPEHLGVLSVFVAIVAVISPVATFRYPLAIPLPKSVGLAMNIAIVSAGVLVITSLLVTTVFMIWGSSILKLLSMEQLLPYWFLIPIAIIGTGMYEILSNWALREKAFYPLAKTMVWQKSAGAVTKIVLGLIGLKPLGLLVGQIITQAGGIVTLFREFVDGFSGNIRYLTTYRAVFSAKRYAAFPKYRMPSQILLLLSSKLVLFYFAWQYGADVAGFIGLALMVVLTPVTLFGYTTGKAYYAEIAIIGKDNPREILDLTKKIVKKLIVVSILPFIALFAFGPWLFEFIFGSEWIQSGQFASILSIYLLVQFIYAPIGDAVFNVFEKQPTAFSIDAIRLIFTVLAFYIAYWIELNAQSTIWIYSIVISCNYVFATIVTIRIISKSSSRA